MGLIQLLMSLLPFLKEMLVGEKIKDQTPKEGIPSKSSKGSKDSAPLIARMFIDKMQESRRFLALIMVVLVVSLFVNYKAIGKLSAVIPIRSEDGIYIEKPQVKEPEKQTYVPKEGGSEHSVVYDFVLSELKVLYKE